MYGLDVIHAGANDAATRSKHEPKKCHPTGTVHELLKLLTESAQRTSRS
jgi:hypothetical protein